MIIEGKHSELGRGVFVSDIQEGSPAFTVGLNVGDMILCVNLIDLIGADYEMAASALKSAEGLLTLVVAKPTKSSLQEMIVESDSVENICDDIKKESINPSAPPPTLPKPQTVHKSLHGPIRTSTATNGSLSRANQKTIPALPTPVTHKTHLVSSNLDSYGANTQSFFTHLKEASDPQHSDLKTCQVKGGRETTIEIVKEKLGPKVLVQTAAHVSGAAFYYKSEAVESTDPSIRQLGVCIHPRYGGWFAIRGIVVFTHLTYEPLEQRQPKDVIQTVDLKKKLLFKFNNEWFDWSYRDIIPVTKKYSDLQIKYFSLKPCDRKEFLNYLIDLKN
ncbi:unnamed protein product [Oppiella nova]|uniref:Cyanocobalamin reductase (cyanide-eliminating) n=1 Tax=Oppiella nova TaxID=334625 RepID=A0A7R9MES7_9ACAR|nr:unnamed protein product [Oppiella nova]CAG2175918.1 unnamed protein product [Oppiella nova]